MTAQRRQATPPDPEELFESWLDDVYPLLKETWLAGYYARTRNGGERSSPPPPSSRQPTRDLSENGSDSHDPQSHIWEIPDDQLPPGWRKVLHLRGERPCRRPAFILIRAIQYGENVNPVEILRTLNGHKVSGDDVVQCGTCGYDLHGYHTNTDLDWTPHVVRTPVNLSFQDEPQQQQQRADPHRAAHQMVTTIDDPLTPEEILNGPQPLPSLQQLTMEEEREALVQIGEELSLFTKDLPDAEEAQA